MNHKYLVTGSTGLLGREILKIIECKQGVGVSFVRKDLDFSIGIPEISKRIEKSGCTVLIHCAANTNVEQCEENIAACYQTNFLLTEILATICRALNIKFVFISSTGIYGKEKEEPYTELDFITPTTVHHTAKYQAENSTISLCPNSLIIRTGWLFGGDENTKKNFVANRIKEAINSNGVIYSDTLQKGNPSYVVDVASRILTLAEDNICGIYNCVNEGVASRFDYVSKIIYLSNLATTVERFEGKFKRIAKVSHNESAINYKMDLLGYPKMRNWQDALAVYINEMDL